MAYIIAEPCVSTKDTACLDPPCLCLANCCFSQDSSGFSVLLRFFDAQSCRSFHPFHRRPGSVARSWRGPFPHCGVASPQAPDPDLESLSQTISQSTPVGPDPGLLAFLVRPTRLLRSAIVLKPSTLLALHKSLNDRKYRMLFSPDRRRQPGPKGPSAKLIRAVVEMKQRNPNWGCPRIAQQMALAFHIQIDKDVVRRILARHHRPGQHSGGPSWLTFLGHMKDSLWSMDLFRCESASLRTHWVLVVMDQYTRRIIGFGVHVGKVDGVALCRMFNRAIQGQRLMPKYLSSDNDPLYRFHRWQANLRILEVTEIKTIPYVPLSHPFVERLIGTLRREYLDRILFWTRADLENKLLDFKTYFNNHRTHTSREGRTPDTPLSRPIANLHSFRWQPHCRALYQTPLAA
jgi:putative transposase